MQQSIIVEKEIAALKGKYKNDSKAYENAIVKVYDKYHVNPFGGILPIIIQLPIITGLYQVFYNPLTTVLGLSHTALSALGKIASTASGYSAQAPEISLIYVVQHNPKLFPASFATEIQKIMSFHVTFFGIDFSSKPDMATIGGIVVPIFVALITLLPLFNMLITSVKNKNIKLGALGILFIIFDIFTVGLSISLPVGVSMYWIANGLLAQLTNLIEKLSHKVRKPKPVL